MYISQGTCNTQQHQAPNNIVTTAPDRSKLHVTGNLKQITFAREPQISQKFEIHRMNYGYNLEYSFCGS